MGHPGVGRDPGRFREEVVPGRIVIIMCTAILAACQTTTAVQVPTAATVRLKRDRRPVPDSLKDLRCLAQKAGGHAEGSASCSALRTVERPGKRSFCRAGCRYPEQISWMGNGHVSQALLMPT
jgi:hypothetical protein